MDTLRGNFEDRDDLSDEVSDYGLPEDDTDRDGPPPGIGNDERRMQVRAYNHWASLLQDRSFPAIEDLEPENLPDFGPYSVLLDFTAGIENPGVSYLGKKLASECDADGDIYALSDVPSRSLLSRITDHYLQILANQAPIGFEAEFVNQRGLSILYRGILLPFSSDDDTIDFIYGVINWKEMADQKTTQDLLREVDQALGDAPADDDQAEPDEEEPAAAPRNDGPLEDWADGPAGKAVPDKAGDAIGDADENAPTEADGATDSSHYGVLDLGSFSASGSDDDDWDEDEEGYELNLPRPSFGLTPLGTQGTGTKPVKQPVISYRDPEPPVADMPLDQADEEPAMEAAEVAPPAATEAPAVDETPSANEADPGLWDRLADARELAETAKNTEDRSRGALYEAIGKAYDFSLAAAAEPQEFDELLADSGLTRQDRAPLTPVVKLVFGADYDKTRLTEYATALGHAHRLGLERGAMGEFLKAADGGLKAVVKAERQLRREETGQQVREKTGPSEALARKLRAMSPLFLEDLPTEGEEFALVMIRRMPTGEVAVLGEVPQDIALVERAARRLTR